jgi:zinc protease
MKMIKISSTAFLLFILFAAGEIKNPFPQTERYKLKNGMEIIFADYGTLPVSHFSFFINVGQKSETPGQQGLADLTANAITLGNEKYNRVQMDNELFRIGGSISSSASENTTVLSGQFLNRDIEKGIELLSMTLLKPSFPEIDINQIRNFNLSQNKPAAMDINQLASVYGDYFYYGLSHPLGRHYYAAQYNKIGLSQLKEFYNFNYTPANVKLVVTGKPDRAQVKKLIEQYFGAWSAAYGETNGAVYDMPSIKGKQYAFVNKTGATQACLLWMKKAPAGGSKDEIAFQIANRIFTDRLMNEIREKRGYTYGIYSMYDEQANDGLFRVQTQVRNEVVASTIEAFDLTIDNFSAKGVTEKEMRKAKTILRNQFIGMESPGGLAYEINPWVYKDYAKRSNYIADLEAIDLATLNKIIQKYYTPYSYKLMIAGDDAVINSQTSKLNGLLKLELTVIEKDM